MLLIRQAILDCQYLDKAADECQVPHSLQSTLASVPPSQSSLHSITFSTSILAILTTHHEATFDRCLGSLISSVTSSAYEMSLICDMRTDHASGDFNPFGGRSSTTTRSRESSSSMMPAEKDPRLVCLYPDPYLARSAVAQRTVLLRVLMDRAAELVNTCFSDICEDYRAIVEIHGVAMLRGKGKEDEVCYSSLLMVKFIEGVCAAFENTVGVSSANFMGRASHGSYEEVQRMKVPSMCGSRLNYMLYQVLLCRVLLVVPCLNITMILLSHIYSTVFCISFSVYLPLSTICILLDVNFIFDCPSVDYNICDVPQLPTNPNDHSNLPVTLRAGTYTKRRTTRVLG
jgi:hypothetical protein